MAKKRQFPLLAFLVIALVAIVLLGAVITQMASVKSESEVPVVSVEQETTQTVSSTEESTTEEKNEYVEQPNVPKPDYPENWEEYVNEEFGYSFAYPTRIYAAGFNRDAKIVEYSYTHEGKPYFVRGYAAEGFEDFGGVKVTKNSLEELKKEFSAYQNATIEEITFNGYAATQVLSSYYTNTTYDNLLITDVNILIPNGDVVYILNWNSGYVSELSYDAIGKTILNTFHLDE